MFVQRLEQQGQFPILLGTDTSGLAAPYILASGREVLPIGGYFGAAPARPWPPCGPTSTSATCSYSCCPSGPRPDPRLRWIEANCTQVGASNPLRPIQYANYRCPRTVTSP